MSSDFSAEKCIKVWNDGTGERIEIGPDSDGLELCQVRSYTDTGDIGPQFVMQPKQAVLVANAIIELFGDKETA